MHRLLTLAALGAATAGCTLIFGDVTQAECFDHGDCLRGERCTAARRCVVFIGEPDLGPEPADDMDADLDDLDQSVDPATPDRGLPADMQVDAAPDAEIDQSVGLPPVFGATGDCFGGDLAGQFTPETPATGALHAPQAACTPHARLWTAADAAEGLSVAWDRDGDPIAEPEARLDMAEGTVFAAHQAVVLVPRLNPAEQAINIWRQDLTDDTGLFVVPSSADQAHPARSPTRSAFVQTGTAEPDRVRVHFDADDSFIDCGQPDRRQWGVAVGDDWTAWFEQRLGSRRARLVVLESRDCADPARRERLLTGDVAPDARLHPTARGVVWLQAAEGDRLNQLYRWRFTLRGAEPEPLAPFLAEEGNPIELATRGRWMALISYRAARPPFVIDLVNLDTLNGVPIGAPGVLRRPALSDAYVVWAAQTSGRWEIRYEQLIER